MNRHAPRRHSTETRDPLTGQKIQVFVASCPPCNVWGKVFRSRNQRDKFITEQHT